PSNERCRLHDVRIRRQSTRRDRATSAIRVASSARRGFTRRSTYNANCFLRKRFSAASWACDLTAAATKRATSEQRRTSVPATARKRDRLIVAAIRPDQCGRSRCVRALLGTGPIRQKLRRTAFLRTTGWEVDLRLVLTDDCEHRERRKAPVSTKTAAQRWGEEREREWYYALTHPQPQTPPKEV